MKDLKLICPILLALLFVNSAFAQSRFYGKVTEVVDGRTIIVEPQPQVKIKIQLQYIEVPEAEQKLHSLVKTHLTNLLLNKTVEFRPKNVNETAQPIGQILLGGVDISQQMLRDGAAWYSVSEKNLQSSTESKVYRYNETQAKNEKRGVWGVEDLKPAWEFRAEKEEKKRLEELKKKEEEKARIAKARAEQRKKDKARAEAMRKARAKGNYLYGDSRSNSGSVSGLGIEVWQNNTAAGMAKKSGYQNLYTKYIPQFEIEYTLTGGNFAQFSSGENKLKIESRSLHIKHDKSSLQLKNAFGIGFLTQSENGVFEKSNDLTIYADKRAIKIGKAFRLSSSKDGMIQELLLYNLSEQHLVTISQARNVRVKIGSYTGLINPRYKSMVKELVESTK